MANLPQDIIVEILPRLPVKSLIRFRCVGKPWFTLITSSKFVKTHLNRVTQSNDLRFLLRDFNDPEDRDLVRDYPLNCIDCDRSSLINQGVEIEYELQFSRWKRLFRINSSCHGVFCLTYRDNTTVRLWNPSTREFKKLLCPTAKPTTNDIPKTIQISENYRGYLDKTISYGFGYDSIIDDYKIVKLIYFYYLDDYTTRFVFGFYEVKIYTLGTDTWRSIQDHPNHNQKLLDRPWKLVNGFLHWLAADGDSSYPQYIVAFDLAMEEFREVPPPNLEIIRDSNLSVWEGCLCLGRSFSGASHFELWALKDYGVKDSWTKIFTLSQPMGSYGWLAPLCFSKTGEVILGGNFCLVLYDPENGEVRNVEGNGVHSCIEAQVYVESLVSLN